MSTVSESVSVETGRGCRDGACPHRRELRGSRIHEAGGRGKPSRYNMEEHQRLKNASWM